MTPGGGGGGVVVWWAFVIVVWGGGDVIDGDLFFAFFCFVSDSGIRTRTTIIRCMLTKPAIIRGEGGGGGGVMCGQVFEWMKGGMERRKKKTFLTFFGR